MASDRRLKEGRGKDQKAVETLRPTREKAKSKRLEELSPEQRAELARKADAKQFRGKPPSI
jgi:hypothetical protein